MKKLYCFGKHFTPFILAFISFLYSVSLWFYGYQLEGIFVGIWVPSILILSVVIRQRTQDYKNEINEEINDGKYYNVYYWFNYLLCICFHYFNNY